MLDSENFLPHIFGVLPKTKHRFMWVLCRSPLLWWCFWKWASQNWWLISKMWLDLRIWNSSCSQVFHIGTQDIQLSFGHILSCAKETQRRHCQNTQNTKLDSDIRCSTGWIAARIATFYCNRFGSFEKILKNSGADVKLQSMNCQNNPWEEQVARFRGWDPFTGSAIVAAPKYEWN